MAIKVNSDGQSPLPANVFSFGKHKGRSFLDVANNEASYCNWALNQENPSGQLRDFAMYLQKMGRRPAAKAPASNKAAQAPRALATPQNAQLGPQMLLVCELVQEDRFLVRPERIGSKDRVL